MEIGKALLGVLSKALTQILAAVKPLIPPIIKLAAAIGGGLAKVLLALLPVLVTLLPVLVELAVGVLIPLVPVITALANALAVVAGWLGPLAPVIVAMVVAWAAYQAVTAAVAIATGIMSAIQLGQAAASVTATAAQWLLNAAMSANPVMLVVLALAALVGGLIIAYQKVDWFRSICDTIGRFFLSVFKPAFDAVSGAIAALWHWITGNSPGLIPAFQLLMVILGPVASFLAGVVAGAFRVVQAAVAAVFSWIAGNWPLLLGIITGPIGLAVMLVIQHWATLRAAVAAAVAFVRAGVSAGWSWAVAFTRATWSALSGAVAAALGAIRSAVAAALGAVRGLLSAAWSWARDTTAQMWAAISTVIRGAWDTIKGTVGEAGQWVITKLQWVWDQVKAAASNAWNGIVAVIRTAWDKVQNVVAEPARFVAFKIINPLVKGVNALVTKVGIPAIPEIPKFAEGGRIPGGWGGGDRQLILAEPGEWMLTKRQARAIGYGRLRGLPRYAEGGEIGHPSHGPQLRGPFDWLGDLGSKAMRISHVGDLLKLGGDVVDTFSGMLKWAAAQAFKAATEPLRKLAKPYADERVPPGNVMKQYLGKLAIDIIDKAIEFIESKSASECEAGGVVAHAMQFDGKPYRWGGPANPSQGFDCSSFVSFIAGSAGLPLPGGFKVPASSHGPITNDYLSFGRLKTIGRDAAQPGDIAVNTKHIGFIIGPGGAGFAARSTATGIGKQSFASGYTYRTWGGGEGSGTCEGGTGPDGPPNGFPAGVKHYAGLVARIAAQLGVGFATNAFLSQMQSESGGNPRAINNWDSNAKKGTPSKGLMQVIDPTFLAYAGPHKSKGIWNPEANIYAAINYAKSRYGSRLLSVIGRGHGYARGGIIPEHVVGVGQVSGEIYHIGEAGPEMVSPLSGRSAAPDAGPFTRDRGGTVINVYPREGQSEEAIAAAVSRRLAWAEAGGRG
jgi:phage-related protein